MLTPLVAEVPALAALVAVQDAELVVIAQFKRLKPTPLVLKIINKVFAVRFAGFLAQGMPKPATASILVSAIALTLEIISTFSEEVKKQEEEEEKEEEDQNSRSDSASATSSTPSSMSSGSPEATPVHIMGFSGGWPNLLLDVVAEFFPNEGEGDFETLNDLDIKYYATNITEGLANAISWLPLFSFIVPDEIPFDDFDDEDVPPRDEDVVGRRWQDESVFSENVHAEMDLDATDLDARDIFHAPVHTLDKRAGASFPPRKPGFTIDSLKAQRNPSLHLRLPSFKENLRPNFPTFDQQIPLVDNKLAEGASIHIIDTGLGTPAFKTDGALPRNIFTAKVRTFLMDHALDRTTFTSKSHLPTLYNGWIKSICRATTPPVPRSIPREAPEPQQRTTLQPELAIRQEDDDILIPIVENGTLIDPDFAPSNLGEPDRLSLARPNIIDDDIISHIKHDIINYIKHEVLDNIKCNILDNAVARL
ncbi:hypothetical protein GGR54DRAFT_654407 [Hypoxylon sp. NC1633]|nr:hypothetical protein GGR54DRAFT_654407 [Hypoxylon sp. NC1633]